MKDPLHEILERHLYRFTTENESPQELLNNVISDYLMYLDTQGVHIPVPVRAALIEDLKEEIRELAVKKSQGSFKMDGNPIAGQAPLAPSKLNRRPV